MSQGCSMHTLKLKISDALYSDVLATLDKYPKSEVQIKQKRSFPKELLVSSVEEVRRRVYEAEQQPSLSEDEYESLMDEFFENELGIKR